MRAVPVAISVALVAATPPSVWGQDIGADDADPPDFEYATGLLSPTAEELASVPATPLTRAFLPELVDLSSRFPEVGNQGALGSCTSWAVGYAARSYYSGLAQAGKKVARSDIPSPAYIHGMVGAVDSRGGRDPSGNACRYGASIADAMELLKTTGAASLREMPYSDRDCRLPPKELVLQVQQSTPFRIERTNRFMNTDADSRQAYLDKIKTELARGHPVVIGLYVNKAFHRLRGKKVWKHTGRIDHDSGHAITLVGYDERGQYFKFINSWGTKWGDRGFGRVSYETVSDLNQQPLAYSMRVAGIQPPEPDPDSELEPDSNPPEPSPVGEIELPKHECGIVDQLMVDGKRTLVGFVRDQSDLDKIKAAIGGKDVKLDVAVRPWPQCEALMTLRDPLKDSGKPVVSLPKTDYAAGDDLSFKVGMGPFEGYLHVAYVQADGNVVNLVQQGAVNLQTIGRGTELTFGGGEEGRAKFTISEPYGKEMVIAISSASPLFPEPRPTVEVEREFLSALRAAILTRPDPNLPERRISAAYAVLETKGANK